MTGKICPECGTEHEGAGNYCKNCGSKLIDKDEPSSHDGMKTCPKCGESQIAEAKFCKNCGASFENETEQDAGSIRCAHCGCELKNEQFCPDCGKETGIRVCPQCRQMSINENYCPACGYRINSKVKTCNSCGSPIDVHANVCPSCGARVFNKNPIISLVLSFIFPGLGQLYNTQNRKGITLIIGYVVALLLTLILIGAILALIIWAYGMYDAYSSAKAMNEGEVVEDRIF